MEAHGRRMMTDRYDRRVSSTHITVIRFAIAAVIIIAVSMTGQLPALAQTADAQSPPSAAKTEPAGEPKVVTKRSLFFPDLAHSSQPLTSGEKFTLALTSSVSPAAFLGSGLSAGVGQAADRPAGYGQGAAAFGQRFGAAMATNASTNLMGTYFLSAVLHDDPRYFVMGDGSLKQSFKYALRRVVIVRKDDGGEAFNWPGVVAPLAAAGLANVYMPQAQRTVEYTFESYATSLGVSAGVNLLKEYWPTITRRVLVPLGISHAPTKP